MPFLESNPFVERGRFLNSTINFKINLFCKMKRYISLECEDPPVVGVSLGICELFPLWLVSLNNGTDDVASLAQLSFLN